LCKHTLQFICNLLEHIVGFQETLHNCTAMH